MAFKPASRKNIPIKLALMGMSHSGKTYSALRLARGLVGPAGRIALIDTENGSASINSPFFEFDVENVQPTVDKDTKKLEIKTSVFKNAVNAAIEAKYDCLIIDSASHIWESVLTYKSKLDSGGGNSFAHWQDAGEKYKDIMNLILYSPIHVICCFRVKTDYVIENEDGKQVPRKVGMAPIAREGMDYEFSVVFNLAWTHLASIDKDRTGIFIDEEPFLITEETGEKIAEWLQAFPSKPRADPPAPKAAAVNKAQNTPKMADDWPFN